MSEEQRPYWAAEPEPRTLISRAMERMQIHIALLQRSGRLGRMFQLLSAYYGGGIDGMRDSGGLRDAGEDGEVTELHVNQVRPIVNNTLSLIAGQRMTVKAKARNGDSETLAQVRLAEALREAFEDSSELEERETDVKRGGLIASAWSLGEAWSPKDGREWMRDESGQPVFEGDFSCFSLAPWQCAADFAAVNQSRRKWVLFRRPFGRWDTAAQFDTPTEGLMGEELAKAQERNQIADAIRKGGSTPSVAGGIVPRLWAAEAQSQVSGLDALMGEKLPPEDVVWVWELRHLKSPALPKGRLVRYIEPDVVLWDSLKEGVEYPYSDLHVYEWAPERVVAGGAGHTGAFDLGAIQEFVDICTTSMATTVNINGQMNMWGGDVGPPQVHTLSTGNNVLTSPQKPEPLEFPALKPEVVAAADWAITQARQQMALNDVVMGQPDKGMPAQAQALQRAQAQQYHAVAQAEAVKLRKRSVNGLLSILKRFARAPRVSRLAGRDRQYEMKEWSAESIEGVEFFDVELVDPAFSSYEGRQSALEILMGMGAIKSPDALETFMQTGSLETLTAPDRLRRELIEANTGLLQRGIGPPPVDIPASMQAGAPVFVEPPDGGEVMLILKSDPHHLAVPAYLGVLSSPTSRTDAKVMKAALEAVQYSLELWAALTPDEAAAFGIPPLPSQMAMAMGPPGAPTEGAPGGPAEEGAPPAPTDEQGIKQPTPPDNPLTETPEGP